MTTLRTFTARIARVHNSHSYPRKTSLVLDKLSELAERPRMQNCSLLPHSRYPVPNAPQFFNCDASSSVFSLGNDLLGNDMVHIGRETILSSCKLPEFTVAPTRPLTLQFGSEFATPIANAFYGVTGVGTSIRVRSDLGHTEVHPQPFVYLPQGRFFHITRDAEIPLATVMNQVGLALALLELFDLTSSGYVSDRLPTPESPDVNLAFLAEAKYPVIIGNGASFGEPTLGALVDFVSVCNFGKHANCELGCEFELLPGGMVERFLEGEVGEHLDVPRLGA